MSDVTTQAGVIVCAQVFVLFSFLNNATLFFIPLCPLRIIEVRGVSGG